MKKGTISILIGLLLLAAALMLECVDLAQDKAAGTDSAAVLEELEPAIEPEPIPIEGRQTRSGEQSEGEMEYPDYVLDPDMALPTVEIDGQRYVGTLSLPTLEIELPVNDVCDHDRLFKTPCRYTGTAYRNDLVICAHNYRRHFGRIKTLRYGDEVTFTDVDGNVFRYRVLEIENLWPNEVDRMKTGEWDLTLFTCSKTGRTRVTVRCERV